MTIRAWPIRALALTAVLPLASHAIAQEPSYSIEDVQACSGDAMRLCKDKIPDLDAIQACMKANYDKLRPACKKRFDR